MGFASTLYTILTDHLEEPLQHAPVGSRFPEAIALSDLLDLFCVNACGLPKYNLMGLFLCMRNQGVTCAQYDASVAILRKHGVLPPPPLEVTKESRTCKASTGDQVFLHLAAHKNVPQHKLEIIYGILGCSYSRDSYLTPVSDELYKQREDEPRMQLILAILETKVE